MGEADLKAYNRVLNDYHIELLNVASLSSHLLDLCLDDAGLPDWRLSACHMMRDRLCELVESLPFPSGFRDGGAHDRSEARTYAPTSVPDAAL